MKSMQPSQTAWNFDCRRFPDFFKRIEFALVFVLFVHYNFLVVVNKTLILRAWLTMTRKLSITRSIWFFSAKP